MNTPKQTPYQFIRSNLRERRDARQRARRIRTKKKRGLAPLAASMIYLFGQTEFAQLMFKNSADLLIMKLADLRRVEDETGQQVSDMSHAELLEKLETMNIRTARVAKNEFGEALPFLLLDDSNPPEND